MASCQDQGSLNTRGGRLGFPFFFFFNCVLLHSPPPAFAFSNCTLPKPSEMIETNVCHTVLLRFQQPAVIAEVITGILLGPTVMGRIPNFSKTIFPTANMTIFSTFAEVGLVLFMNLVGLELDFALMAGEWKSTALISIVGIALPMAVSVGSSYAVWDAIDRAYPSPKTKTFGTYVLFMYVVSSSHCFF
jgi:Kef-type K+ transport system membrane component KefB